jgi:hypothetical protein
MKKGLVVTVVLVILVAAAVQAQEWGRYPTIDAFKGGIAQAGYDTGYADGYNGYPPRNLWGQAPEYQEGYNWGYRDGMYHRGCGRCGYGYYSGYYSTPAPPQIYWGISIRGKHGGFRIGGWN